jgi:hypothetical protein
MQNMIGMLAQSFGIDPNIAGMAVNGATKMFLKKSAPKAASGLLFCCKDTNKKNLHHW